MVRNTKRPEGSGRRYALNMKTTGDVRERLAGLAKLSGRSLTLEVEHRLIQSFEMEIQAATLTKLVAAQEVELAEYSTNPHEAAAVKAFAFGLRMMQRQRGASWREGGGLGYVVGAAVGKFMARHTRYPTAEGLQNIASGRDLDVESEDLANVLRTALGPKVPPLPEVDVNPFSLTDHVRHVVRIKDKATGAVLETLVMREGRVADLSKAPLSPAYLEGIERYRARRLELETEVVVEQVAQDNPSVWEAEDPAPAAYLVGQEEATKLVASGNWVDALPEHPASLFDKADADAIWRDPPRDDDGERGPHDNDPGEASPVGEQSTTAPAPRRGRRARVKA